MRISCRVVLTLCLVALLAGTAHAQQRQRQQGGRGPGGQGGLAGLLQNESVQKELKVDKDQADKLKEAVQKVRDKHMDDFAKLRDLDQAERRTKGQELARTVSEETLAAAGEVLKPEQVKRLKQIELQQAGAQAFGRPDVQRALALTDDQKAKLKESAEETAKQLRELRQGGNAGGNREKAAALRKESLEKAQGVLTDDQKKTWKEMTGEPFEIVRTPRARNSQ
jgi:hypothetical protein